MMLDWSAEYNKNHIDNDKHTLNKKDPKSEFLPFIHNDPSSLQKNKKQNQSCIHW